MSDLSNLQGDGVNLSFFNLLWSKSIDANDTEQTNNKKQQCVLRIPDTIVFLFGQPQSWFFTSKNGGETKDKTMILSKRKTNISLANIEEAFLHKANTGTRRGAVGEEDVVAYFISSNSDEDDSSADHHESVEDNDEASPNNIEYFNKKTLHDFLQHGRHNKSGILQRFIAPHGGGTHNSQIRAIWTPKLCVLERRRTKQDLHDIRFALYERCITFDGPDVHSVSVPLRGSVLSGRVETICNEIVRHISEISAENTHGRTDDSFLGVARMVVNFKVDGNGKIWILWSNSIRLQNVVMDSETKLTAEPDNTSLLQAAAPLNMETVVRLPSTVKLTQAPNHNANVKPENQLLSETCPSCNKQDDNPHFQPVPYKTVITHFEKTLEMLEEEDESHPTKVWPPEDRFIKAAGNVGFGSLSLQLARDKQGNNRSTQKYTEATHTIPPVIRQIHPKLRAKGFEMYRNDPLFLLKNCSVCEDCFLSYSSLATNNFTHITRPVEPFASEQQEIRYEFPIDDKKKEKHRDEERGKENKDSSGTTTGIFANIGNVPELPPAVSSPPKTANSESSKTTTPLQPKDTLFNTMNTYFPDTNTETAKTNLEFLVDSHKKITKKDAKQPATKTSNPYSEKLDKMIT